MAKNININEIKLVGTLDAELTLSHTVMGEKMFSTFLRCARTSGTEDILPIQISERIVTTDLNPGDRVEINGEVRTYNKKEDGSNRASLKVFVFAQSISLTDKPRDVNDVHLSGYLAKKNPVRKTPLGRVIADVIFAVNRAYDRTSYIPCIYWGKNAEYEDEQLPIGTLLEQRGRLQSREYKRAGSDETHIAYECSISSLNVMDEISEKEDDYDETETNDYLGGETSGGKTESDGSAQ